MASDIQRLLQASNDLIEQQIKIDAQAEQLKQKDASIAFLEARVRLLECQMQRARRPFSAVPA